MNKDELLKQLREIEEKENLDKENKKKIENFERFMQRSPDFMVGKAHCELDFINKRYASDRNKPIMPTCVEVSGNCSKTYYPRADVTESTRTYFHNVWSYQNQDDFQQEMNELAYKYINKVSKDLKSVLELMGLQSLHYYVTQEHFRAEDLPKVKEEIQKSQFEILQEYPDEDFKKLVRNRMWTNEEGNEIERVDLDLSHSTNICKRYLEECRPELYKEIFN